MNCSICNTQLKAETSAYSKGVCIPCSEDRSLFNDAARNIREFGVHVDSQCIDILKLKDCKLYVDYEVTSTLWDIDPRFRSRSIKAGSTTGILTGILRLYKESGEVDIVYPILHDKGVVLAKAKACLNRLFDKGEYPDKTGHYCS